MGFDNEYLQSAGSLNREHKSIDRWVERWHRNMLLRSGATVVILLSLIYFVLRLFF